MIRPAAAPTPISTPTAVAPAATAAEAEDTEAAGEGVAEAGHSGAVVCWTRDAGEALQVGAGRAVGA